MNQKKWLRKLVLNEHLDVVLDESGRTWILLDGEVFLLCKRLVLDIPIGDAPKYDRITSIDEAVEKHATVFMGKGFEPEVRQITITPEEEYFGHCSNLQAWVDHDYDTRILHANISFNLLRGLAEVGDEKATRVLEGELVERVREGNKTTATAVLATFADMCLPESLFYALAGNPDPQVRLVTAKYKDIPASAIERLANDDDVIVRRAIAERSDIPEAVKEKLAVDKDASVRHAITVNAELEGPVEITCNGKFLVTVPGNSHLINLSGMGIERISDIHGLDKLVNLKTLVLSENHIERIECLEPFAKLQHLSLGHNRIKRIEGLDSLVNLLTLAIPNNQIERLEGLEHNTKIYDLRLYDNRIARLEGLDKMAYLSHFVIYTNKIIRIEGLDQLKFLSLIDLSDNQISRIEGFDKCGRLHHLNLAGNRISVVEKLDSCKYLGMLNLCDNRIDEPELARVMKYLEQFKYMKSVGFSGNPAPFDAKGWIPWPLKSTS